MNTRTVLTVLAVVAAPILAISFIHRRQPSRVETAIGQVFDLIRLLPSRLADAVDGLTKAIDAHRARQLIAALNGRKLVVVGTLLALGFGLWAGTSWIGFRLERAALIAAGSGPALAVLVAIPLAVIPCLGSALVLAAFGRGEIHIATTAGRRVVGTIGAALLVLALTAHVWGGIERANEVRDEQVTTLLVSHGISCSPAGAFDVSPNATQEQNDFAAQRCTKVEKSWMFAVSMQSIVAVGLVAAEAVAGAVLIAALGLVLVGLAALAVQGGRLLAWAIRLFEEVVERVRALLVGILQLLAALFPYRARAPRPPKVTAPRPAPGVPAPPLGRTPGPGHGPGPGPAPANPLAGANQAAAPSPASVWTPPPPPPTP